MSTPGDEGAARQTTRLRRGARVVLLDPDDRVLMLRVEDPSMKNPAHDIPESYWITLGGGLEGEETYEEGARREVFEETGLSGIELGPELWRREREIEINGEPVLARERFYSARTDSDAVDFGNLTDEEREVFREHRWWSLAEILDDSHGETLLPRALPDLVARAIEAHPPRR